MDRLNTLLNIPDPRQRIEALIAYARSLGIDPIQAQNSRCQYSEEKLALLIFDATHNIQLDKKRDFYFASGAFIVAIMFVTLMFLMPRFSRIVTDDSMSVKPPPPKTFKAYDSRGQAVREEQQPVLFELMEGTYQQLDEEGRLKYEMDYVEGELVRRREYSPDGELIGERTYSEVVE